MDIPYIENYLLINSNQYYVGAANIEVDANVLNGLIDRAMQKYGYYKPYRYFGPIQLSNNLLLEEIDGRHILNIDFIYMFDPVFGYTKYPFTWHWDPVSKIFKSMGGGNYYAKIQCLPSLADINTTDLYFLDLLLGYYLIYIGSVRKGFKIEGMTIENDGDDIVSRGQELIEKTVEQLTNVGQSWWMTVESDLE